MIRDFTSGPVLGSLLRFSLPFMLSNAMQVLYSLVDMFIVNLYLGSRGVAAVSIASQLFVFLTMLCLGFSSGGQVLIAQLIGRGGDPVKLNRTIGTLFSTVTLAGAGITVLGLVTADPVLRLLATPAEVMDDARDYTLVCSAGILFAYGYNMVSAVLRGMGDSRHPFIFILIASILNIVLDWLFIAIFHWGVFGAGLATILSQGIAFFYALIFLMRHRAAFGFDFRWRSFRIAPEILRTLTWLGVPFAIRFAAIHVSMLFVNALVNGLGYQAAAVFGIGVRLDDFVAKVSQGIMLAGATMIGQNFSAGKTDRIARIMHASWFISSVMYMIYLLLLWLFPYHLYGCFTDDPEVLKLVPVFIMAIIWHYPAHVIMRGTNALIHGIGHAWLGLAIAAFDGFVVRLILSWLFGITFDLGFFGFILGYALATWATALPGLIYYLWCPWQRRRAVID